MRLKNGILCNEHLGIKNAKVEKIIEEIREKINVLVDQNALNITEEVLDISRKLDMFIMNYYYTLRKRDKL